MSDPRFEWRLSDIEHKADRSHSRLHELDSLSNDVCSLRGKLSAANDEIETLKNELSNLREKTDRLEEWMNEIKFGESAP